MILAVYFYNDPNFENFINKIIFLIQKYYQNYKKKIKKKRKTTTERSPPRTINTITKKTKTTTVFIKSRSTYLDPKKIKFNNKKYYFIYKQKEHLAKDCPTIKIKIKNIKSKISKKKKF